MDRLIAAIRVSCSQGNWYAALFMALTMPDICGKLEDPASTKSERRYRDWFDKFLAPTYRSEFHGPNFHFLASADCWALRCSLLHEGSDEISGQRSRSVVSKFKFTTMSMHRIMIEDILVLNVSQFCEEMCRAVESWLNDAALNADVQRRIREMVKIEGAGFSPHPGVRLG